MIELTKDEWNREVSRVVDNYRKMREDHTSLYNEAMWSYADMANGGRAHDGNETYIRDEYYRGYPDEFFVLVLSGLGEFERYTTLAMEEIN